MCFTSGEYGVGASYDGFINNDLLAKCLPNLYRIPIYAIITQCILQGDFMKPITNLIQLFVAVGIALFTSETAVFAASDVHKEIGYVVSNWEDTPSKQGLLPIAFKESLVAAAHASYSENSAGDLQSMKMHVGHVRHAIDPTLETISDKLVTPAYGFTIVCLFLSRLSISPFSFATLASSLLALFEALSFSA